MKLGIKQIESALPGCIRFKQIGQSNNKCHGYPRVPSVYLMSSDAGCFADTGAWPKDVREETRYEMNIGGDCTDGLSTIIHELGHVLGMCHE